MRFWEIYTTFVDNRALRDVIHDSSVFNWRWRFNARKFENLAATRRIIFTNVADEEAKFWIKQALGMKPPQRAWFWIWPVVGWLMFFFLSLLNFLWCLHPTWVYPTIKMQASKTLLMLNFWCFHLNYWMNLLIIGWTKARYKHSKIKNQAYGIRFLSSCVWGSSKAVG